MEVDIPSSELNRNWWFGGRRGLPSQVGEYITLLLQRQHLAAPLSLAIPSPVPPLEPRLHLVIPSPFGLACVASRIIFNINNDGQIKLTYFSPSLSHWQPLFSTFATKKSCFFFKTLPQCFTWFQQRNSELERWFGCLGLITIEQIFKCFQLQFNLHFCNLFCLSRIYILKSI